MKKIILILIGLTLTINLNAQEKKIANKNYYFDLSIASNKEENLGSLGFGQNWNLGKKKSWRLGYGIRFSTFYGKDKNYVSAPPSFYGIDDKTDSLFIRNPQQNNLTINLSATYIIKNRIEIGFNIDLIGYTFGKRKNETFIGNGIQSKTEISPNSITALLIGPNDIGMVKAEFMLGYWLNKKWMARVGFSNLYTEYKTKTELQKGNYRFRGTSSIPFIAIRYALNNK